MNKILDENYFDLIVENTMSPVNNEDVTPLNETHHTELLLRQEMRQTKKGITLAMLFPSLIIMIFN